MAEQFPDPPPFYGRETGWLEPSITRAAEQCARQGARAAIEARARLPTPAEAERAVQASEHLAHEPDWQQHADGLAAGRGSFVLVALAEQHCLDDDPPRLIAALRTFWQRHAAGASLRRQFLDGLSTPSLLVLKVVMDTLAGDDPAWDAAAPSL